MNITPTRLRSIILEEITSTDKKEIKAMIAKEIDKELKSRDTKAMIRDELEKLLNKTDTKNDIGDIVKKVLKRLYRDMSVHHPYMIDRIKV
jgi:predicted component of type VI protein secretion system